MKFEEIYDLQKKKHLSVEEAANLLGVDVKTFRRWRGRYETEGIEGLYDNRLGRIANNAAPVNEVMKMLDLFRTYYSDFNTSHFYYKYIDTSMEENVITHGLKITFKRTILS
jgi:hypothetical protein